MLSLQQLSYIHPNKDLLFGNINLHINAQEKIALIGHNGVGKSTLLRLIAKELSPTSGSVQVNTSTYYVPQVVGQFEDKTVAEALSIEKIECTYAILAGDASEENFNRLQDDWTLEERCQEAFKQWDLPDIQLTQQMSSLSGGQNKSLIGRNPHSPIRTYSS
jgi:ATPase subunit of ABC transporter with duplicated ATPase domains